MFKHFTSSFYGPCIPIQKIATQFEHTECQCVRNLVLCCVVLFCLHFIVNVVSNFKWSVHLRQLHFSLVLILPFLVWLVICVCIFFSPLMHFLLLVCCGSFHSSIHGYTIRTLKYISYTSNKNIHKAFTFPMFCFLFFSVIAVCSRMCVYVFSTRCCTETTYVL